MNFIKKTICLATSAMMLAACSGGDNKEQKETVTESKPRVKVMSVTKENVPQIVQYTATIEAYKTNNITTSTQNRIKKILTDVGRNVKAGQLVAILDDVNIEQMRLRLENQKVDLQRAEELLKIGGGTQQSVDQLRTEYNASLRSYNNMVENTRLISPISGVVTARNYENGDMTGSLPILTIEQIQPVKVFVNVAESEFTKVKLGQSAKVTLDVYGEEVFEGKVALIHPTIDAATRTFQIEVNIANADSRVRPGMFARVEMNYGTADHVVVPDVAIVKQTGSGNKYVYVYNNGKVEFVQVQLGQRFGNRFELVSGLEDAATVIISGQSRLANGVEVDVISDTATSVPAKTENVK